jgi:hypothetical protein
MHGPVFSAPCHFRFAASKTVGLVARGVKQSMSIVGTRSEHPAYSVDNQARESSKASVASISKPASQYVVFISDTYSSNMN